MAISEERVQILLPSDLKRALRLAAHQEGLSVGEYLRRLIEQELRKKSPGLPEPGFSFGRSPIHTGRRNGSLRSLDGV